MINFVRAIAAAVAAAAPGVISLTGLAAPAAAQTAASVSVNAAASRAVIPGPAWGLNAAVWDGNLLDAAVPGLASRAGVAALRFPGGSTSDVYNWQTNSIVPGQSSYANPNNNFDAFMGLANRLGATPIITVNYGSNPAGNGGGDPSFAASWVRYANVTKGYGVKYWEIGNEVYGNGIYGAAWETDLHAQRDPATYGRNVAQFAAAMKAVDPSIKVGAVLTAPGNWPDGLSPDWNTSVLAQCASAIDFVILHWYPQDPGGESDANLLAAPQNGTPGRSPSIAAMASRVKSLLAQYAGARAATIQILVTETNSVSYNPGKQTLSIVNAMFVADSMLSWIENGVTSVDLWDLHNGPVWGNNSSGLFGTATYGDYGVLSNGQSGEPAANTPFPAYYGFQMATLLGKAGDTLVDASSSNNLLTAHAVRQANGSLALLLINKDRDNTVNASVSLSGFNPGGTGTVYSYTPTSSGVTSRSVSGQGASFSIAAPPYSLTAIVLAGTATPPSPSFTLSANPSSLSFAQGASGATTISVAPAGGFSGNVTFAASGLPAGVTASFNPPSSATSTTLTLAASPSAPTGVGAFTIAGASGALSATTGLALTITGASSGAGPATFAGKASTNSPWFNEENVVLSTTAPITALTVTITVPATDVAYSGAYNTFGGQIVNSHTDGATIVYSFRLSPGQTIAPGSVTFAAQMSGNGATHDVSGDSWTATYTSGGVTYTRSGTFTGAAPPPPPPPPPPSPSFALSANPASLSIAQGASGPATITVNPAGGFTGDVAFAVTGLPSGVTASFAPTSSPTSTTLTLSANASAAVGTGALTITGTSGALSATTSLPLTVTGASSGSGPATFTGRASTNSPWFNEEDVMMSSTAPITALTVTIAVAATDVAYNGAYNTIGGQIVSSYAAGANLVYTFRLSPGQTIGPTTGLFAAQMNGNGTTHNVAGDSWTATYVSGGVAYTQSGRF